GAQVPRRGQARLADAMIEHAPGPLAPVAGLDHLAEQRIRAAHPSGDQVDPALGIEPAADETAEVRVEPGLAAVECEEGLHARSSLTSLSLSRLRGCVAGWGGGGPGPHTRRSPMNRLIAGTAATLMRARLGPGDWHGELRMVSPD